MYRVYAIVSEKTGRIYIGQTNNITKRIERHNRGYVKSTSKDAPWHIIAMESFDTREDARWCEHKLKKSKGRRVRWLKQFHI
ncbi:MAG: GIY-YIG nuclease family protein [Candidatus Cloacimonetes bacterium]|nr:GIY-YIG nuclease family protein [Candidatus Cloacimonadota bacterium]